MAPFGKSFLRARLKNRSKEAEPQGKEIQVTVCGEEKAVCGVTKHTTCLDMVRALLDDHSRVAESRRQLRGDAGDFCLVERWKGFERAIPPLTRILRLWQAWGDQRPFVRFVLVATSEFVAQPSKKSVKAKGARPKRREQSRAPQTQEKQRRVVRKAFRKLEKLHQENKSSPGSDHVDKMVQLILNQDHAIREQIQRMRDLDSEIERVEASFRGDELEVCGGRGPDAEEQLSHFLCASAGVEEQLSHFLCASAGVEQLEAQVHEHRALILKLSLEIDQELRDEAEQEVGEETCAWELSRLQRELERTLLAGVSLQNQAGEVERQLRRSNAALALKDGERWQLAAQLDSLHVADVADERRQLGAASCGPLLAATLKGDAAEATDSDSDTGISSTHSQDSLSPAADFPPPLDTDV